jgi:hypothetical protein
MKICAVVAGLVVAVALPARAQAPEPHKFFVGVNAGAQVHSHTLSTSDSFTVYDETATVTSSANIKGGFLFDVSGGYRIIPRFPRFGVSVGLSRTSSTGDGSVVATIPNPILFDSSRAVNIALDSLDHSEVAVNISAVLFMPVPDFLPDNALITFSVGPSIFTLKQELVTTVAIPAGTQDAVPQVGSESKTAVGFHAGFDCTFPVTQMAGIGGFVRYSGGTVDLPSASDVKVGGFQAGAGLRLGF